MKVLTPSFSPHFKWVVDDKTQVEYGRLGQYLIDQAQGNGLPIFGLLTILPVFALIKMKKLWSYSFPAEVVLTTWA